MKLISHRGNLFGSDPSLENSPNYILAALEFGVDCEIDVWHVNDEFMLGHDAPTYNMPKEFLPLDNLWIHAKNYEALCMLSKCDNVNYFWHNIDAYTLTSRKFIWAYPNSPILPDTSSISVILNSDMPNQSYYGVCSDYVGYFKNDNKINTF